MQWSLLVQEWCLVSQPVHLTHWQQNGNPGRPFIEREEAVHWRGTICRGREEAICRGRRLFIEGRGHSLSDICQERRWFVKGGQRLFIEGGWPSVEGGRWLSIEREETICWGSRERRLFIKGGGCPSRKEAGGCPLRKGRGCPLREGGGHLWDWLCVEGGRKPSVEREETIHQGRETICQGRGHCDGWEEVARGTLWLQAQYGGKEEHEFPCWEIQQCLKVWSSPGFWPKMERLRPSPVHTFSKTSKD